MSAAINICQIPGNSDIAGIGVRASVYLQACLAGFNFLYMYPAVQRRSPHLVHTIKLSARPTPARDRGRRTRDRDVEMGISSDFDLRSDHDLPGPPSPAVHHNLPSPPTVDVREIPGSRPVVIVRNPGSTNSWRSLQMVHGDGRSGCPDGAEDVETRTSSSHYGTPDGASPTASAAPGSLHLYGSDSPESHFGSPRALDTADECTTVQAQRHSGSDSSGESLHVVHKSSLERTENAEVKEGGSLPGARGQGSPLARMLWEPPLASAADSLGPPTESPVAGATNTADIVGLEFQSVDHANSSSSRRGSRVAHRIGRIGRRSSSPGVVEAVGSEMGSSRSSSPSHTSSTAVTAPEAPHMDVADSAKSSVRSLAPSRLIHRSGYLSKASSRLPSPPHQGSPAAVMSSRNPSVVDSIDIIPPHSVPSSTEWGSEAGNSLPYCPILTYPLMAPGRTTVDVHPGGILSSGRSYQRAATQPWFKPQEVVVDTAFQNEYMGMIKGLERVLFMVGFAVILSALIQAKSADGLTAYHALVILNISQINNFTGLLLFISRISFRSSESVSGYTRARDLFLASMPSVIHSSVMSALGLYFWLDDSPFLAYVSQITETGCQPLTYIWVFGAIEVSNAYLRVASLGFYTISAIPFLGHFLLAFLNVFMLAMLIGCFMAVLNVFKILLMPFLWAVDMLILKPLYPRLFSRPYVVRYRDWHSKLTTLLITVNNPYDLVLPLASCALLCAPFVYVIVSTELTIRLNSTNIESGGEDRWTYGQTLALFSAIVGIVLYAHELVKIMRESRRRMLKADIGTLSLPLQSEPGSGRSAEPPPPPPPPPPLPLLVQVATDSLFDNQVAMIMAAGYAQRRRKRAWSA
ncbi:hypothetical protein LshimejAT787_0700630 [Lyophyllum shimeji]|uniref:Transmembrane protein n=1 Tax=Lyophyllum shimeji TaxID=47721 RepID=A0A9P3PP94_LYOSH|nr:hypothetical protein LshimejAT787_0700630 [Lyophyllum shimeji]